jgi:uncharacterized SAM-dependent methyltransferase
MINYKIKNLILEDISKGNPLLKYAYLKKGANNFFNVVLNPEYDIYKNEIIILEKNKLNIQKALKENIVVLGVGNADKIKIILDNYNFKTLTIIDYSPEILSIAKKNLTGYNFKIILDDFEKIDFNQFKENISFLFLGGTLFNFKNWECILKKIKKHNSDSNIIIGVELLNKIGDVKKVSKQYEKESVFQFLKYPLNFIGIDDNEGFLKQSYNVKEMSIDTYFIFKPNLKNYYLKDISKQKILLCRSIKLLESNFFKKTKLYNVVFKNNFKNNWVVILNF